MLRHERAGRISPSCRLYPPACKPYGLEAEPEAESKSWAGEKTPVKIGDILTAVSTFHWVSVELIEAEGKH